MLFPHRVSTLRVFATAGAVFGLCCLGFTLAHASSEPSPKPENLIRISGEHLHMPVVHVSQGETVAWISGSSSPTLIVFEGRVAEKMQCEGLAGFEISGGELVHPIGYDETVSFCALAPGRYRYKIYRPDVSLGNRLGAKRMMRGAIEVK